MQGCYCKSCQILFLCKSCKIHKNVLYIAGFTKYDPYISKMHQIAYSIFKNLGVIPLDPLLAVKWGNAEYDSCPGRHRPPTFVTPWALTCVYVLVYMVVQLKCKINVTFRIKIGLNWNKNFILKSQNLHKFQSKRFLFQIILKIF